MWLAVVKAEMSFYCHKMPGNVLASCWLFKKYSASCGRITECLLLTVSRKCTNSAIVLTFVNGALNLGFGYCSLGTGSSVGIATELRAGRSGVRIPVGSEIFHTCPDRPWGPPSLLYKGYRVFPGGRKRPGRDADPSPPSSAEV
jgi:hypothetical protein